MNASRPIALIVSCRNTLLLRTGASEYLASVTKALSLAGYEVSIAFIEEIPRRMLRLRILPDYRAQYDRYVFFRSFNLGQHAYSLTLRNWLAFLARPLARLRRSARPRFGLDFNKPSEASLRWVGKLMRTLRPSVVVANYFNAAAAFDYAPAGAATAIVVHDVLALRRDSFTAMGADLDFDVSLIAEEARAFAKAGVCLAIKDEEKAFIESVAPGTRVVTLPVTVAISSQDLAAERGPICIFVGGENPSNIDGLAWFLAEVWPFVTTARPDARCHIVGAAGRFVAHPLPPGVELLGFVDDLSQAYGRAAVAVTPLRFGSGVKIKLIEGLAYGLPSVATAVGAEGLAKAPAEVVRIEDSAEGFAAGVVAAMASPGAAERRERARAFAREHYDQATVGVRLLKGLFG